MTRQFFAQSTINEFKYPIFLRMGAQSILFCGILTLSLSYLALITLLSTESFAATSPTVGFVFTINPHSNKESQQLPFSNKLRFNYTPNPALEFVEGLRFTDQELSECTTLILRAPRLKKLVNKGRFKPVDRVFVNEIARSVMMQAEKLHLDYLCYANLKSCALVKSISQGRTLFKYDRQKPEKTTVYNYSYNLVGQVALIEVPNRNIVFRKTIVGMDFLAPTRKNIDERKELWEETLRAFGNLLGRLLKEHLPR